MHTVQQRQRMGGKKRRGIIAVIQGKRGDFHRRGGDSDSYLIRKSLYAYRSRNGGARAVCEEWNKISGRGRKSNAEGHPFVLWSKGIGGWERGKCLVNVQGDGVLGPTNAAWCFVSLKRADGSIEIVR